ncbi:MAG: tetratricopeptide repeat protein [bacterium]
MKKVICFLMVIAVLSSISFAVEKKLASAYISEGIANFEQGNYLEAILSLRSAEQLSPNPATVYKYLGMSYSKLSLWQQAMKEFNKILFIIPDDADRGKIIDKIHEWEGQKEAAPAMAKYSFYSIKYKNKIWEEPNNLLNYLSLTEIYKCSGRYDEAANFFRALVKDRPEKIDFKKYLAGVLFLDKKYGEAGGLYRKILEDEPLNTDAIVGVNLILKKRYEDVLAKRPEKTLTYIKLARVLRGLKRYEDAASAYEKYLEKDSANIEARRELDEVRKMLEMVTPKPVKS